jgi:arsenate reductase
MDTLARWLLAVSAFYRMSRRNRKETKGEIDMGRRSDKPRVLFLCTGNSCRSQMAEGWARHLASEQFDPYSAGVAPQGLNSNAVRVMAEAGVDISRQRSKHIDELRHLDFDLVITVCDRAAETCPTWGPNVRSVHVAFDDPPRLAAGAATEEEALSHYRRVRDEIRALIERLPMMLTTPNG